MNPIVIDPPNFNQAEAWKECQGFVDSCGGLTHPDGEPNWRAAFGADPGCCSCPKCGETYWAWGKIQRCAKCSCEYPTDWWPMYSYGTQAAIRTSATCRYSHNERMKHDYYRFGFEHPVEDPWTEHNTERWRAEIVAWLAAKEANATPKNP